MRAMGVMGLGASRGFHGFDLTYILQVCWNKRVLLRIFLCLTYLLGFKRAWCFYLGLL